MRARRHDQLGGSICVEPSNLAEIVDGLLGQILASYNAAARELERKRLVHSLEAQEILGRLSLIDDLLADQRFRDQHVARARTQLVDDLRRELLDAVELACGNIGDLLERRKAFLNEDVRYVLIDVELLHEVLDERARF